MPSSGPDRWACLCGAINLPLAARCIRCGEIRPGSDGAAPSPPARSAFPTPPPAAGLPDTPLGKGLFPLLTGLCAVIAGLIAYMTASAQGDAPAPTRTLIPAVTRRSAPAASPQPSYAYVSTPAPRGGAPVLPPRPFFAAPVSRPQVPSPAAGSPRGALPVAPSHRIYVPEHGVWLPALYVPPAQPADPVPQPTTAEIIGQASRSVLLVTAEGRRGSRTGSGFVVGPRQVATCAHLLVDAERLTVMAPDGKRVGVSVLRADPENDLVLLTSNEPLPPPLPLAEEGRTTDREDVAVAGYPFSGEGGDQVVPGYATGLAFVRGLLGTRVVRLSPAGNPVDVVRVDAGISSGYSGGPVFSVRDGKVFGLISFRVIADRITGYAVPTAFIRRLTGENLSAGTPAPEAVPRGPGSP